MGDEAEAHSPPQSKRRKVSEEDGKNESKDDEESNSVPNKNKPDSLIPFNCGKNVQFHCDYCQKDITRSIRIRCAECTDLDLCIECFSVGAEIRGHLKTHKYQVSDCLAYPLLTKDWHAHEEFLLLEGIEMYGLGNWKSIAEHVATKTDKKCEQHYRTHYLKSRNFPLPTLLDVANAEENKEETTDTATEKAKDDIAVEETKEDAAEETKEEPMETRAATTLTPVAQPEENKPKELPGADLAGYMPLRGDFDVEHDNDAELILADMEFSEDDHPTERELKLRIIDIYNGKLDERERRKQFVIERGLLDYKKHQQIERRRPKDERELVAQMRPFARFHTAQEHNEFVGGLLTAMRLRKRIAQLQHYRKNGIRTLAEAEEFEAEKRKRETELALKKQRESASYLYESGRQQSGGRERSNRWLNRERGEDGTNDKKRGSMRGRGGSIPLDLTGAPGAELLTPKEKDLCSELRLLPKHYMVIKDTLIRESFRLGFLDKKSARQMLKIDVNKTGKIYDFFVSCGWVSRKAQALTPMNNSKLANDETGES